MSTGISSSVRINDEMSPALAKINKALSAVISSYERLQNASEEAINLNELEDARKELEETANSAQRISEEMENAGDAQSNFNSEVDSGANAMSGLITKIFSVASAVMAIKEAWDFAKDSFDAYNAQLNSETQLKAVLKNTSDNDAEAYAQIVAKASEIQSRGIYGDEAMIAAGAEFATYLSDAQAITTLMETLSNYAIGMTGGGEVDMNKMVDFATNLGKVMTGSFDAMSKKGFKFTEVQKEILKGEASDLDIAKQLGVQYLYLSEDMQKVAVIQQVIAESWDDLYEEMSNTPEGHIIQLKNAFGDLKEEIGEKLAPKIDEIVTYVQDHWDSIENIMNTIGDLLSGLIDIVLKLTPVIIGIVDAFDDTFTASKNIIDEFAYYLEHIFEHPVSGIKKLFWGASTDIAGWFTEIISTVDEALASIGWSDGWIAQDLRANQEQREREYNEYYNSDKYDVPNTNSEPLNPFVGSGTTQIENLDDYFNAIGAVTITGSGSLAGYSKILEEYLNAGEPNGSVPEILEEIHKDTSKISTNLEISSEDLKYLRSLAERDAINLFTTAEIKVDMNNTNNISSNMDLDGVVSHLSEKLEEAMTLAAEGVY